MTNTGDGISVSLDDIALTLRALVGRRTEFPTASALAVTQGPANGASQAYRAQLNQAAQSLAQLTAMLTSQLSGIETRIATTGQQLVAADESAGQDVSALQWILGTVETPLPPTTTTPGPTPGPSAPFYE